MRRRLFLLSAMVATRAPADTAQELIAVFAAMAAALSEDNPNVFLRSIDPRMPGYGQFAANLRALSAQNTLASSIELLSQEGGDAAQSVELEWLLEIRGREQSRIFVRRQSVVKCRLEREKKSWRVVALEPAAFFAPPSPSEK